MKGEKAREGIGTPGEPGARPSAGEKARGGAEGGSVSGNEGGRTPWRARRATLLAVLFLAAAQLLATALVFNPSPHTGGDNAGYLALAHSLLDRGAYLELWSPLEPPHTKYPPVFPLLLGLAMALGVKGWAGLKAVPFLSTLLAGVFAFLWARRRGGVFLGLGVALVLAFSDGILDYSRWLLSDPTFLALTLAALWALEGADPGNVFGTAGGQGGGGGRAKPCLPRLMAGCVLVLLAYFTRSAGIPLVAATLLWMALRRWWRPLMAFSGAFFLLAGGWWIRGLGARGSGYVSEFWLRNPYRPEEGTMAAPELFVRIWENLRAYTTTLVPEGIVGGAAPFPSLLGGLLVLLALVGWGRSLLRRMGPAELFFPLYAGLMLLWPQVWSGDRFALPLLPLLLCFGAGALLWPLEGRGRGLRGGVMACAFLLPLLPALGNWTRLAAESGACRGVWTAEDPWGCYPLNIREYILMAHWTGENLPDQAAVITRKPRIFFVESGVKSLSLPLTTDASEFLRQAGEGGARYLTADRWDGLSSFYLPRVVGADPGAFCYLTAVQAGGEVGIQLLGIPGEGWGGEEGGGEVTRCPPEMLRPEPRQGGGLMGGYRR